ncbi:hypothetical protein ACH3XW_1430 [Acanthocheilonema viteae]
MPIIKTKIILKLQQSAIHSNYYGKPESCSNSPPKPKSCPNLLPEIEIIPLKAGIMLKFITESQNYAQIYYQKPESCSNSSPETGIMTKFTSKILNARKRPLPLNP